MTRIPGAADRILPLAAGLSAFLIARTFGSWPIPGPALWAILTVTAAFATRPACRLSGLSACPRGKK